MCLNKEGVINDISRIFLVMCKSNVAYHQKELLNVCVTSRVYPNIFKITQITPINKKSSPNDISIYRPVLVLSDVNKVF